MQLLKKIILSTLLVSISGQRANALPILKEVIGTEAPYFWGVLADDAAYTWHVARDETVQAGKDLINWCKHNKEVPLWFVRFLYHLSKIAGGLALIEYDLTVPANLFGVTSSSSFKEPLVLAHQVCTYLPSIVLIYHGLKGIGRQFNIDSVSGLYSTLENHQKENKEKKSNAKPKKEQKGHAKAHA